MSEHSSDEGRPSRSKKVKASPRGQKSQSAVKTKKKIKTPPLKQMTHSENTLTENQADFRPPKSNKNKL